MVRIVYDDLIRWSSRGETCKRSNSNVESKIRGLKRRKEKRDGDARGGEGQSYEEVNAHIRGILTVGWHAKAPQIRGRKALRDQARSRRSSDRDRT